MGSVNIRFLYDANRCPTTEGVSQSDGGRKREASDLRLKHHTGGGHAASERKLFNNLLSQVTESEVTALKCGQREKLGHKISASVL